jgi:hypothetical protein
MSFRAATDWEVRRTDARAIFKGDSYRIVRKSLWLKSASTRFSRAR